jgi:GEVED domain-containing protein/VCBS repeat protein
MRFVAVAFLPSSGALCMRKRLVCRDRSASLANRLRFEELEDRRMLSLTGDAPNPPFPLAQHSANPSTQFGPLQTADDGITFGTIQIGQVNATATVTLQGNVAGRVDAWIDFNRDGSFTGAEEQIANSVLLSSPGVHNLEYDVPSWAQPGSTWARFRVSTGGGLGVAGSAAANGEVEDYQVTIVPTPPSVGNYGAQSVIEDVASSSVADLPIFSADFDGDGDVDVASATSNTATNNVQWDRNNGNGTFTRFTIGSADDPRSLFAADVDGDGDVDLVGESLNNDAVYWYSNPGGAATGSWTRNTLPSTADGARQVFAADIDRDGDMDIVAASYFADKIAWYDNNGSQTFTERVVNVPDSDTDATNATNGDVNGPVALFVADVDRDGQLDIVTSSSVDGKIVWYQNDGTPATGTWAQKVVKAAGANTVDAQEMSAFVADFDGDGDMDVLTANMLEDRIAWYENDGTPAVGTWTKHDISTTADGAYSVFAADLDGDQDMDVLSASQFDDKIAWYGNNGAGGFIAHTITSSGNADGATNVFAADLNGDGVLDVISGSRIDNKVAWYPSPGFRITKAHNPLQVSEIGSTDTFTVVLTAQPTSNVVFDTSSSDTTEATVSPAALSFTTANWNIAQTVTVSGVNDAIVDGTQISTVTVHVNDASSDNNFDPLADQTVYVSTIDNDIPGFTVTQSGGTTLVSETGTTDTFTVVLTAQPSSNVVFDILSSDAGEATASPVTITFTCANWSVAQTVTVTGVNDSILDGTQVSTVTVRVNDAASDNNFDPLADQLVSVSTTDNDTSPQGDYDVNGQVNNADYTVFRSTFGSTSSLTADGNGSLKIDAGDFVIWRKKFGANGIAGAGAAAGNGAGSSADTLALISAPTLTTNNAHSGTVIVRAPVVLHIPPSVPSIDTAFASISATQLVQPHATLQIAPTNSSTIQNTLALSSSSAITALGNLLLTLANSHPSLPTPAAIDAVFTTQPTFVVQHGAVALQPRRSSLASLLSTQLS